MKSALITGVLGQDGSYLAEYLLGLGYRVFGLVRMGPNLGEHTVAGVTHYYGDLRDDLTIESAIRRSCPDEIYNLAGQVFVPTSWTHPAYTFDVNVGGLARIMLALEKLQFKNTRVYQASSSEMFGNAIQLHAGMPLWEGSAMEPVSPYGVSKLAAHKLVEVYRQRGYFVVSGILFNHESPRRGLEMVTRKITHAVAHWARGDKSPLKLGNLLARRDWGFAGDYVIAMHKMLQQAHPNDYVIGTGVSHSVGEFCREAIRAADLHDSTINWVQTNQTEYRRENELHCLIADYSRAKRDLNWQPTTTFQELVEMMVKADIAKVIANESKTGSIAERIIQGN